jgi:hypothetical protein
MALPLRLSTKSANHGDRGLIAGPNGHAQGHSRHHLGRIETTGGHSLGDRFPVGFPLQDNIL